MAKAAPPGTASAKGTPARPPRGTGAEFVYEKIKSRILYLDLMPGTFLDETELSNQFGVSRSPVREALIRLAAEGLVQNFRNRTSTVSQFDIAGLPAYFDAMDLMYRFTARLAALTPNAARLETLRCGHAEHETALRARDIRLMVRHNRDFHIGVAEMGGNPLISQWMGSVLDQGQRLLGLYGMHLPDRMPADILKPHRDMLDAIAARDPDAAEAAASADALVLIEEFRESLARRASDGMTVASRKEVVGPAPV